MRHFILTMKFYIALFLFFFAFRLSAQPVIHNAGNYSPGMKAEYEQAQYKYAGPGGMNQTWVFDSLAGYIVKSEMLSVPVNSQFPNADIMIKDTNRYTNSYDTQYLKITANENFLLGVNGTVYTDSCLSIKRSFTYGDTFSDSFSYANGHGYSSSVVDGYGTLQLPSKTYFNTTRVRTVSYETYPGTYGTIENYHVINSWYNDTFMSPLVVIDSGYQVSIGTVIWFSSRKYFRHLISEVPTEVKTSLMAGKLQVYPNPARDILYIENNDAAVEYRLINITGATQFNGSLKKGRNTLDISELSPGLYILQAGTEVIKLLKE